MRFDREAMGLPYFRAPTCLIVSKNGTVFQRAADVIIAGVSTHVLVVAPAAPFSGLNQGLFRGKQVVPGNIV